MNPVTSNIIAASAGTGKTYKLASRFISLLALGYPPEKLIALTFTRNAAGEFRRNILRDLAKGAESEVGADALKQRILTTLRGAGSSDIPLSPQDIPDMILDRGRFRELLRTLVRKLSHLHLCTLDSFFSKLVSTNCMSLGFPEVNLMSDPEKMKMRKAALHAMIDRGSEPENEGALLELCENISEESSKTIFSVLEENVADFFVLYEDTKERAGEIWGDIAQFGFDDERVLRELQNDRDYPSERRYLAAFIEEREREIAELADSVAGKGPGKLNLRDVKSCKGIAGKLRSYLAGEKQKNNVPKGFGALLYGGGTGERGIDELMDVIRKTRDVVTWMPVVRKTRAMVRLMQEYETHYARDVVASGKLVFDDMPRLVAEKLLNGDNPGAISDIAYRLDGQLSHWMLDEFQDTSPAQWRALKVLLEEIRDEVVAGKNLCAERSIFVVGDEKQSIYGWRGATPQLFSYLRNKEDGWEALQFSPQNESFRSTEAIMGEVKEVDGIRYGFVNELFAKLACVLTTDISEEFTSHTVAQCNMGKPGYVRVQYSPTGDGTCLDAMCERMLSILTDELHFTEKKITVAILVRSNENVRAICRWFHSNSDLPIISMSDEKLSGSSLLGECLLHFFRWLRHPVSTHCLAMAKFSPLHVVDGEADDAILWKRWRGLLETEGYARVVELLTNGTEAPEDAEGRDREEMTVHDWLNEARAYDAEGGSLDDWLLRIANLLTKANASEGCIHVMTFHKSKGLGYDAVLLPFSSCFPVYSGGIPFFENVLHEKDRAEVTGMVLNPGVNDKDVPSSPYRQLIEKTQKELMKEALHVLYVAVTRAKRANYILLNENAYTDSYSKLIGDALMPIDGNASERKPSEQVLEWGNSDWVESMPQRDAVAVSRRVSLAPPTERRRKFAPSEAHALSPDTDAVYTDAGAALFGTSVHALFEQIEWINDSELPAWVASPQSPEECSVVAALREPSVRALFTRREGQRVYREQGIETIRNQRGADVWVSGTIDRLILTGSKGRVIDAHVIDFKTDIRFGASPEEQLALLREKHSAQLNTYCELIAEIFPDAAVHATIVSCPRDGAQATSFDVPVSCPSEEK